MEEDDRANDLIEHRDIGPYFGPRVSRRADGIVVILNGILQTKDPDIRFIKFLSFLRTIVLPQVTSDVTTVQAFNSISDPLMKLFEQLEECVTAPALYHPDAKKAEKAKKKYDKKKKRMDRLIP